MKGKQIALVALGGIVAFVAFRGFVRRWVRAEPGPYGYPLIGVLPEMMAQMSKQHFLFNKWMSLYGNYYTINLGVLNFHVFCDPADIAAVLQNITVFSERDPQTPIAEIMPLGLFALSTNAMWKKHRATFAPLFGNVYLERYFGSMVKTISTQIMKWGETGGTADIFTDFNVLALDTLGLTILGAPLSNFIPKDDFRHLMAYMDVASFVPPSLRWFPYWPLKQKAYAINKTFISLVKRLIEDAKTGSNMDPHCLLVIATRATNDDGTPWSEEEVISEVQSFVLAGFETTSNTLCFVFHLLAVNPRVQSKARDVIRQYYTGRYASLKDLDYLWAIMRETLRLYPTVPVHIRVASKNVQIGRAQMRAGEAALLVTTAHNLDPAYFDAPKEFRPERWLDETTGRRLAADPYAHVKNFGGGRRVCIGTRFAEEEIVIVIALTLQTFVLRPDPSCDTPFVPTDVAITLAPENVLKILMTRV